MESIRRYKTELVGIFLSLYTILLYSKKIILVSADLGRHLENGRLFFEKGLIHHANYYSYTEPDFSVVTHHWGSGVLFYSIFLLGGFAGLSLFHGVIAGVTSYVWYLLAVKLSNVRIALTALLIAVPLITYRVEIRPEIISYLLFGFYLFALFQYQKGLWPYKKVALVLVVLQVVWVNMHVFFIFGFLSVGLFLGGTRKLSKLSILLGGLILASLINPFGIYGLIEPFTILREYGYMIIENQSIPFIQGRFGGFIYGYTEVLMVLLGLLWSFYFTTVPKDRRWIPLLVLSLSMGIFAWRYIRVIPVFGLVFVVAGSYLSYVLTVHFRVKNEYLGYVLGIVLISIVWVGLGFGTVYAPWHGGRFGLGLFPGVNASAEFYKTNHIEGPVFNNYDIGGYLIYHLSPEKVFVDNRPEAYSVDFFKNIYIKAQEDDDTWRKLDDQYHFNSIYFYRLDATPWGQPFLIRRIADSSWVPVYVDALTIILVKKNDTNARIIQEHALPPELFVTN